MRLKPLAYHRHVADLLETRERKLWDWFQSDTFADEYAREARLRLDRSAIRIGNAGERNARRHELAEIARQKLGLEADIALYHMHDRTGSPNAALYFVPGTITIAFEGRLLEILNDDELLDIFGHEMAHYKLYQEDDRLGGPVLLRSAP